MEWTDAGITMIIILFLALGRTIMDRHWAGIIGVTLLLALIVVPLTLNQDNSVSDSPSRISSGERVQTAAIIVDTAFVPSTVQFESGKPAQLVFWRSVSGLCNEAVVFPALGMTVELPVGEKVIVEIERQYVDQLEFSCRRGKMRGIVKFAT
jgi:plastocyanin domain-containing protein